jgi:Sucrose synthase
MMCIPAQPEFIIGNYSDGNLVASLLSNYMGVTQCNIAHALEKTKYSDADIHWWVVKRSCRWRIILRCLARRLIAMIIACCSKSAGRRCRRITISARSSQQI